MKNSFWRWLTIICLTPFILGAVYFFIFMFPVFHTWRKQMAAGRKYMDSMTENDFKTWGERTQKYLDAFDPKAYMIGDKPVPPELKELKIVRIDEDSNWVSYVWMGGMDHTELIASKLGDGSFQFTARYDDEDSHVIWPKAAGTTNLVR